MNILRIACVVLALGCQQNVGSLPPDLGSPCALGDGGADSGDACEGGLTCFELVDEPGTGVCSIPCSSDDDCAFRACHHSCEASTYCSVAGCVN
jgi:hypothetical protein